jgi:hypothetical protein
LIHFNNLLRKILIKLARIHAELVVGVATVLPLLVFWEDCRRVDGRAKHAVGAALHFLTPSSSNNPIDLYKISRGNSVRKPSHKMTANVSVREISQRVNAV